MSGVTITDVKIIGLCRKHRSINDEILKDINGREYLDNEIYCVECNL